METNWKRWWFWKAALRTNSRAQRECSLSASFQIRPRQNGQVERLHFLFHPKLRVVLIITKKDSAKAGDSLIKEIEHLQKSKRQIANKATKKATIRLKFLHMSRQPRSWHWHKGKAKRKLWSRLGRERCRNRFFKSRKFPESLSIKHHTFKIKRIRPI